MDLRLMAAEPTAEERAAVDLVLGPAATSPADDGQVARGGHEFREQRHLLLPALHALQRSAGWISEGGLNYVCQRLDVPPAEAYGVASFYALFSTEPRSKTVVHVCDDIACMVNGASQLIEQFEQDRDPSADVAWIRSPCLGMCERAPAAFVQASGRAAEDRVLAPVTVD
ncbi:MAG TPA: NAD(P)H-dependent oxidoreductase subunit E, partial [Actinomycetota bacterium]|nr:NAD(P)H-dependent oxidoreductase subunit E [Actinomycetota bacterium]